MLVKHVIGKKGHQRSAACIRLCNVCFSVCVILAKGPIDQQIAVISAQIKGHQLSRKESSKTCSRYCLILISLVHQLEEVGYDRRFKLWSN